MNLQSHDHLRQARTHVDPGLAAAAQALVDADNRLTLAMRGVPAGFRDHLEPFYADALSAAVLSLSQLYGAAPLPLGAVTPAIADVTGRLKAAVALLDARRTLLASQLAAPR